MNSISIAQHWRELVAPHFDVNSVTDVQLIHTGGSDRRFYRLNTDTGTYILQETSNLPEFQDYTSIGIFLKEKGINVPGMIAIDAHKGLLLMQDAGRIDLYSVTLPLLEEKKYGEVLSLYRKVLDSIIGVQKIPHEDLPSAITGRCFDAGYYRWETDYFIDNCIGVRFGITEYDKEALIAGMESLADSLDAEPAVMVHRDFQSQNIYLKDDAVLFLDFQSARLGSMFYDIASLLKDPYVELPAGVQQELLEYYFHLAGKENIRTFTEYEEGRKIYHKVALQRLMQALGAYGNLGINKGKKAFLRYVSPALRLLEDTLNQVEGFEVLKDLVWRMRKLD